jgi:hypothetical protein
MVRAFIRSNAAIRAAEGIAGLDCRHRGAVPIGVLGAALGEAGLTESIFISRRSTTVKNAAGGAYKISADSRLRQSTRLRCALGNYKYQRLEHRPLPSPTQFRAARVHSIRRLIIPLSIEQSV